MATINRYERIAGLIPVIFGFLASVEASIAYEGHRVYWLPTGETSSRKVLRWLPNNEVKDIPRLKTPSNWDISDEKNLLTLKPVEWTIQDSSINPLNDFFEDQDLKSPQFRVIEDPSLDELQIRADRQFWAREDLFIADGDVAVFLNGAFLHSDRIEFDKSKKNFIARGNVRFEKGDQFIQASFLQYNFLSNLGEIKDVYGVVNIKLMSNDFTFISYKPENKFTSNKLVNNKIKSTKLIDNYTIKAGTFDPEIDPIKSANKILNSINKWRFQAKHITLNVDGWKANKMSFTNDPFTPAQARIEAQGIYGKDEDGTSIIKAENSQLILEDKIRIPMGSRKFGGEKVQTWVFGIDTKDRDGLFIGRSIKPIKFSKNFKIYLQPQFLLQRALNGETNSYSSPGSGINSEKVSTVTGLSDLFGIESTIIGSINQWETAISANISSFNKDRFLSGSRYSSSISKQLSFWNIKGINTTLFGAYRYQVSNGSLGKNDIYTAYGSLLEKEGGWSSGKINYKYNLNSGFARYQAERVDSLRLKELWRTSFEGSLDINYRVWANQKFAEIQEYPYNYSPKIIFPGLSISTGVRSSYLYYSDSSYQSSITFSAGPEFTLGTFTKPFLDYTKISIKPSLTIKGGRSPFKFDNIVDLKKLKINLTQQIAGPVLFNSLYEINIDPESDKYGESINSKFSLIWQKRAYSLGFFYDLNDKSGGALFRLNGFDFDGTGSSFSSYQEKDLNNLEL